MSVTLEWDDKVLKEIFDALSPEQQLKIHANAMRTSATKLSKQVKASAKGAGLGMTGEMEKNGWRWVRFGRVPAAVSVGKLWKKGTAANIRVFNRGNKRYGFANSAPHAHLVILGHKRVIPQRDGTMLSRGKTKGVPIYQAAYANAEVLFEKEIEASVGRMVRKLNKGSL